MAAREDGDPTGVLLLDKPTGPTSHDAVDRARGALGLRRVGHTGTLDPFASGLLILCAGPATRLAEYFQMPAKRYEAVLRLGVETETLDPEGDVVGESETWRDVGEDGLRRALAAHTGRIRQVPPAYSAKRVDGRRAHRAAREGRDVELDAEEVVVHELALLGWDPPEARVACRVSTGTYVRALARDVGRALGCGAHLRALRRTAVGPWTVERALSWDDLEEGRWREAAAGGEEPAWLAPARSLPWLPVRELSGPEARRVRHGSRVPAGEVRPPRWSPAGAPPGPGADGESAPVLLVREGRLLAVAEETGDELQPRKVWPDAA
jgi:tRNA pseudouridine55 synthase